MKIWVMCDLEGVAGLSSFDEEVGGDSRYYEMAKRLATQELNALVEGALAGGATEIVALDGHGAGGLDIESLHPEVKLGMRWGIRFPWGLDDSWDAGMLFGHHAMIGTPNSILCHSWDHINLAEVRLNGEPIGEIGAGIRELGYFGVPAIFLSGDRAAVAEAQALAPHIVGVAVKEMLPTGVPVSLAPAKAREVLRASAEQAMSLIGQVAPIVTPTPCELSVKYNDPAHTEGRVEAGWRRVDEATVAVEGENVFEVMRKFYGG